MNFDAHITRNPYLPVRSVFQRPRAARPHRTAILTGMGTRFTPEHFASLGHPPACIVTTEEGFITEGAISSLVIADKLWHASEWLLIRRFSHSAPEVPGALIGLGDEDPVVLQITLELERLHQHPAVGDHIRIKGLVLDVNLNRFREVARFPAPG